jgi:hypothetical protein
MADSKVSELTAATSAGATDLVYLVQTSTSKKITAGNLLSSMTQFSSAPAASVGAAGDKKGMIAFDSNYLYICTANYTGSSNVWKRASITSW